VTVEAKLLPLSVVIVKKFDSPIAFFTAFFCELRCPNLYSLFSALYSTKEWCDSDVIVLQLGHRCTLACILPGCAMRLCGERRSINPNLKSWMELRDKQRTWWSTALTIVTTVLSFVQNILVLTGIMWIFISVDQCTFSLYMRHRVFALVEPRRKSVQNRENDSFHHAPLPELVWHDEDAFADDTSSSKDCSKYNNRTFCLLQWWWKCKWQLINVLQRLWSLCFDNRILQAFSSSLLLSERPSTHPTYPSHSQLLMF